MGLLGGGFLRLWQSFLYFLAFAVSAIVLGLYSYFLAVLSDRDLFISNKWKVVEGISGAAVLYCIIAVLLTCCLGGVAIFGFIAILLNLLFAAGFIALAVLTRDGANSCTGRVVTPIGTGQTNQGAGFGLNGGNTDKQVTYRVSLGTACRFNRVAFACSIIAIFFFILLAIFQVFLISHGKKEKRYGPSPANGYTAGSGKRRFWQRRNKHTAGVGAAEKGFVDTRPSHDTGYTGSTVAPVPATGLVTEEHGHHGHSTHGRYYTQPEGTGVNPYGYENGNTTSTVPARNF